MNKHEQKHVIVAQLRHDLEKVMAERSQAVVNPTTAAARVALRKFQAARMTRTHADLLASDETRLAAQFFLDDLYGSATDFTQRDADIERIIPMLERLMPLAALQTIAEAIELDALSEFLDCAMAARLGVEFGETEYIAAYRATGQHADREKQIGHIDSVGNALCELVRMPLVGGTLAMMSGPARMAGLGELHHFLNRGFAAFKHMRRPHDFVTTIVARETAISENLYAGRGEPFRL